MNIDLTDGWLPLFANRQYSYAAAAKEAAWMIKATQYVEDAPRFWHPFADRMGLIESAYGYRMRRHFGYDQLSRAIDRLRRDPTDRQVFISIWSPRYDNHTSPMKNTPCIVGCQFFCVDGSLNLAVFLRSSDMLVGLPYDMMSFSILLHLVASELDTPAGTLQVHASHCHFYARQLNLLAGTPFITEKLQMLPVRMEDVFTEDISLRFRGMSKHPFNPKVEAVQ